MSGLVSRPGDCIGCGTNNCAGSKGGPVNNFVTYNIKKEE